MFPALLRNRPNCACVHACVARKPGEYTFTEDDLNSGISQKTAVPVQGALMKCQRLSDLIDVHIGPKARIDYLSLDLEGAELDILESLDLSRHTVDIISIELYHWLPEVRLRRVSDYLAQHGFRFFERLVHDEIYIRRRGFTPDPTCMLPSLDFARSNRMFETHRWSQMRSTLWSFLQVASRQALAITQPEIFLL